MKTFEQIVQELGEFIGEAAETRGMPCEHCPSLKVCERYDEYGGKPCVDVIQEWAKEQSK